jgi:PhnB protein
MASVSTYLNFRNKTEEAFLFYKSVFGGEFEGNGISRMGNVPLEEGQAPLPDSEKNLVMHVSLPILGGHLLMGTDVPDSFGQKVIMGNSTYINLQPDTREELDRLFNALSEYGEVEMKPKVMFWGDYFASCKDKFGICWMFNTTAKE